jgi:hypothetical protein
VAGESSAGGGGGGGATAGGGCAADGGGGGGGGAFGVRAGLACLGGLAGADGAAATRVTVTREGVATLDAVPRALAPGDACPAGGGGKGAARTTVGGRVPARESDCGVVSDPSVTSAGRVTAAANAVPATAAVAMIVRPLLTCSP